MCHLVYDQIKNGDYQFKITAIKVYFLGSGNFVVEFDIQTDMLDIKNCGTLYVCTLSYILPICKNLGNQTKLL
jgi:hypothetical protein